MKPERWRKIESIFHKALDADASRRGSVIEESCAGDEELRREVESLLAHHSDSASFIEPPAFAGQGNDRTVPTVTAADSSGPDLKGSAVGHYRILEEIGVGGMGVVYKAEDTRLGRLVALKFLPEHMAADSVALERFRREARAASALNHPNICTIYDIVEDSQRVFIAMECLDGQTLTDCIGGRALTADRITRYGGAIAEALAAAHAKGVIHRDIKPGNIFVTTSKLVKVLDFGVAKLLGTGESPTVTGLTNTQGIIGTLPYMSPEQLRGREVDVRSDIYSLGVVLYEMCTGGRPYTGDVQSELIDAIFNRPAVPPTIGNPKIPARLDDIVLKCLEKDPEDRYQTAKEIAVDLRRVERQETGPEPASSQQNFGRLQAKSRWEWAMRAAVLLIILIGVIARLTPSHSFGSLNFEQITFSSQPKEGPLVTDGTRIYFQSRGVPMEMSVMGGPIVPLRASVAGLQMQDISPDGSELLALKPDPYDEDSRGTMWTIPVLGGSPRKLGDQIFLCAHWSPDGHSIAYTSLHSPFVSDGGGENVKKIWEASGDLEIPYFSPDSRRIRVTVEGNGSLSPRIWEVDADGRNAHPLALAWPKDANESLGQWTPDNKHFIFLSSRERANNIYELIQPSWFEFWKKPVASRLTAGDIDVQWMTPSRASDGIFMLGGFPQGVMEVYDGGLNRFVPFLNGLAAADLQISPDKKWMAYRDFPLHHLWRSKLDGSEKLELTKFPTFMPHWSPDSKWIAFSKYAEIFQVSVDGGDPETLTSEGGLELSPAYWPDGKSIAFSDFPVPGHIPGIKVLDLTTRKVSIMPGSEGFYLPAWSPDGQYMAALADNPARAVLYTVGSKTWRDLKTLSPWGYFVWGNDSKSIYLAARFGEPKVESAMYRLTIDGKLDRVAKYDGLTISLNGWEGFPSITADGRFAMMSDTSVVQIYSLRWNTQ